MPCLLNEDPAPAWGQTQISNRLCGEWNEKSPEEKDLGQLLDGKLNMSWQGALAVQKPTSKSAWPAGQGDSSFLLCFVRPHLGTASSSWVSMPQMDMDQLEWVQRKATKMIRVWNTCPVKTGWQMGLFGEEQVQGRPCGSLPVSKGGLPERWRDFLQGYF